MSRCVKWVAVKDGEPILCGVRAVPKIYLFRPVLNLKTLFGVSCWGHELVVVRPFDTGGVSRQLLGVRIMGEARPLHNQEKSACSSNVRVSDFAKLFNKIRYGNRSK